VDSAVMKVTMDRCFEMYAVFVICGVGCGVCDLWFVVVVCGVWCERCVVQVCGENTGGGKMVV
jgi:hypothetical protein